MHGVFEKTFLEISDKEAPLKTKILRHNNSLMSKELRKNIVLQSKLKNSFNKRQRNFCVNLLIITKRNFFKNLNEN